jgi:ribosomal protein S18 acetylase RimI-like enzyme
VDETTPALRPVSETAGLTVSRHPLMVLEREPVGTPAANEVEVRLVNPEDDLARFGAVGRVGFAAPGTAVGPAGAEALAEVAAGRSTEEIARERERLRSGRTVMAVALVEGVPVSSGSYQPAGGVAEITGVATLPAFRRRGIAAALTTLLVRDAARRGTNAIFLSADDASVARIYERIGFRRIGTACIAEPALTPEPPAW